MSVTTSHIRAVTTSDPAIRVSSWTPPRPIRVGGAPLEDVGDPHDIRYLAHAGRIVVRR